MGIAIDQIVLAAKRVRGYGEMVVALNGKAPKGKSRTGKSSNVKSGAAKSLNGKHLNGLAALLQPEQRGPAGDGPKVYCATCHVGINRPLNGVNMVKDFPELIGTKAELAASPPPAAMANTAERP